MVNQALVFGMACVLCEIQRELAALEACSWECNMQICERSETWELS